MMRSLNALGYVVSRGLRGMGQAPLVQLIAVATMAVCMLLLGVVVLGWTNARGVAQAWGVDVPVTVYLADDAPPEEVDELVRSLEAVPQIAAVERVSPEAALERLSAGLGEGEGLLDGVDADVLPASLELDLRPGVEPAWTSDLADQLDALDLVEETAVAGAWAGRANEMISTLRELALGAGILVGFACMAIVWSTIRLGVYARRAEIQILRLVGGTARFVHGPFLIEGMIQGACGAGLALGLLWLGFDAIVPFVEQGLSLMFAAGALHFFTPVEIGVGVGFGALVGALGSRAAVARYVEA
jgi:cell division transport system permease protein